MGGGEKQSKIGLTKCFFSLVGVVSSLRNKSRNLSLTKLEAFEKTFHNKPIHVQLYISNRFF